MKQREFVDLGGMMDEIFSAAENLKDVFEDRMGYKPGERGFNWDARHDFYPFYSYPPANIYMTENKTIVFEFALAGFEEENVNLEFRGDYMYLNATVPEETGEQDIHYLKRRLKFKNIKDQKYYVPEDKFDREKAEAVFKNGVLTVTVPPKEEVAEGERVSVNIKKEGS
ncbi:MAG: Hsp20/alpha crystallin family protein [Spirochaetota bacterium]